MKTKHNMLKKNRQYINNEQKNQHFTKIPLENERKV